jgi:hypothetical protein
VSEATILYAVEQPPPPTHQERLNLCRPTDRSASAIELALTTARRELEDAGRRLDAERTRRRHNLQYGTVAQVMNNDARIPVLEIEAEQFTLVVNRLSDELATAQAAEVEGGRHLQSLADAMKEPNSRFQRWLTTEYPKHARAIAEGLEKFRAPAINAAAALDYARQRHPFAPQPDIETAPRLDGPVSLPGFDGGPAFVEPPPKRNPSANIDIYSHRDD